MREGKVGIDSNSFLPPFLLHGLNSDEPTTWGRESLLLLGDKALIMFVIGDSIRFSILSALLSSVIISIFEWDIKLMSCLLKDWLMCKEDPEAPWRCWWVSSMLLDEMGSWANGCLHKKQKVNRANQEQQSKWSHTDCFEIISYLNGIGVEGCFSVLPLLDVSFSLSMLVNEDPAETEKYVKHVKPKRPSDLRYNT